MAYQISTTQWATHAVLNWSVTRERKRTICLEAAAICQGLKSERIALAISTRSTSKKFLVKTSTSSWKTLSGTSSLTKKWANSLEDQLELIARTTSSRPWRKYISKKSRKSMTQSGRSRTWPLKTRTRQDRQPTKERSTYLVNSKTDLSISQASFTRVRLLSFWLKTKLAKRATLDRPHVLRFGTASKMKSKRWLSSSQITSGNERLSLRACQMTGNLTWIRPKCELCYLSLVATWLE